MQTFKAFFKSNSPVFFKLISTQLGMTFFGLIVNMAGMAYLGASQSSFLLALASCFSVLFYLFLQFTHMKEHAMRDAIRIEAGRMKRNPFTGLYVSLLANSLNILLGAVACVSKLFISNIGYFAEYAEHVNYTPVAAVNISALCQTAAEWLQAMYLGISYLLNQSGNPLFLLAIILPSLLVCWGTYALYTSERGRRPLFSRKKDS